MPFEKLQRWHLKWPDLSLRIKCLLLISFPAAATVVMFGVANMVAARNATSVELVNQALRTGLEIQSLRAAERATSADARAYFITTQEPYIAQARSSLAAFDAARQQLLRLTSGGRAQQQRLQQIAALEDAREERMFGDIARFREGSFPWEQVRAGLHAVETERDQMEALMKAMDSDNARDIETLLPRIGSLSAEQGAINGICLFFGLLGGATMTFLFARGITKRVARLQQNVTRLVDGAQPELLAGRDEIGAVNEGLIQVAGVLQRQRLALDNSLDGIAEVDASGRYLWLNKAYAEMAGFSQIYKPSQIVATVQQQHRIKVEEAIQRMRTTGRSEIAARIDNPVLPVPDVAITFLATGENPDSTFCVFLRDVWTGKRGNAALIRAKDAALASNRAKTEFLAKISHDIRTPLNAILGAADLLAQTPLSSDQTEYVSMFQRNCRRLVALINDFLDFSRVEAGAVRVERVPVRIRETVDDAVKTFGEAASRKGVTLGMEVDPAAPECTLGDPLRIQQVLVNLLSNALKFTMTGRVDVKVKVARTTGAAEQLRFEVSDTGPGIRLEDQDRVFSQFVQLDNQSEGQRGSGLGLTICRHLVELMGGEIGVVSREGSGSSFHFSLPLEAVEPVLTDTGAAEASPPAHLAGGELIRILLSEDTEDNRLLMEHYLRDEPVQLRIAVNGQEALDAIQQGEQFDLILMDINMPVMDGYTATRLIRAWQHAKGSSTPIVALSADAMREAVCASLEAGCVAHVAKPVDRETLLKTIRRFAARRAANELGRTIPVSDEIMALVPQYLAYKEGQIEEARAALVSRDFGPIRRFGHNLKGTGRGYGFPPIEELGKEIERAAAQANASRIAEQLDALHRFVTETATERVVQ